MTLSVVVTLTSLAIAIVAPLLAAYRGHYYYFCVLLFTFCNLLRYVIKINQINEDTHLTQVCVNRSTEPDSMFLATSLTTDSARE